MVFIPYNYLYRVEVMQIKKALGIAPPKLINDLLKINIWLSLFVFFVALLLFITIR